MNLEAEKKNMQKIHHILNLGGGGEKKKIIIFIAHNQTLTNIFHWRKGRVGMCISYFLFNSLMHRGHQYGHYR